MTGYFSARSRAYSHRLVEAWGCAALNQKIIARSGNRVQQGPFRNLILSPMAQKEHLAPYLLGIYEKELHQVWDTIFQGHYSHILDVGSKFGFYAVGLSRLFPETEVVAFDPDPWARAATQEMARVNQTPKVSVQGFCDPPWLRQHLKENAFILSDCEGYESILFGTEEIPALKTAVLLLEIHDQLSPGASDLIRRTFASTHDRTEIPSAPITAPVKLEGFTDAERALAGSEFRTAPQCWYFLTPKPLA
jgi:hypothetical protein